MIQKITVEEFAIELSRRVRMYCGKGQYDQFPDCQDAYIDGVETAIGMMYIDLIGTPKNIGMLLAKEQADVARGRDDAIEVDMPSFKRGRDIKVGEEYYFVYTDFRYIDIPTPIIKKERIDQIEGDNFATRNQGDKYQTEHYMAFATKKDAEQYALRSLVEYRKNILKKIDDKLQTLRTHSEGDKE